MNEKIRKLKDQVQRASVPGSNFKPTIVIEGRAHQFLGPLQAKEHETPRFAQVWVHDPAMETTQRLKNMSLPASATKAELEAVERIMKSLYH